MTPTTPTPTTPSAARRWVARVSPRNALFIGVLIAVTGVLAAAGMAWALWNAEDSVSGGRITAGDVGVTYGSGTWQQVTAGVTTPAGGSLAAGADGFHSMPGDVIEIRVPVTTTLQGDNLNAAMRVEFGSGAAHDLDRGVISATYRVDDSAQEPVSEEAELGTPVQVPGLTGSSAGTSASWTVVVTVSVLGEYRWTDQEPLLDLDRWSVDGIDVTLQQVRSGEGYVTAGDGS